MRDMALPIKPSEIIELVIRHRWFIIVPFCLSMIAGICFAITLPKVYSARTMILVQPQKVPSNFVKSLVSVNIDERISTIRQQILSRSNLEKIIEQFKLFAGPEHAKMYEEDKIEALHKRIFVDVTRARRGADAFSIEFKGKDPERVMRVANSLASFFINENLKVREAQAMGTSDFLDDQLITMRKRLVKLEEALKTYRKENMGALPGQLNSNLSTLGRLQDQLDTKQEYLRDAKNRLRILERQISEEQNIPADTFTFDPGDMFAIEESGDSPKLQQLKEQLESLKTRYTDKHPDVARLKRAIAKLEGEIEKKTEEIPAEETLPEVSETETELPDIDYAQLQKVQRDEVKQEVESHKAELAKLLEQINIYQQRVEDTPSREQELLSLQRDYGNIQTIYSSLLNRKLEAEISVSMEKKQKGEQFRILDFAKLPEKPISPNVKKIFVLSLVAGLGIGGGFIFLLFYFDSSFRKPEDLESVLGVPVLTTVPVVYHPKDLKRQKLHLVLSVFSIMVSLALLTGFSVLTVNGVDKTLTFIKGLINI